MFNTLFHLFMEFFKTGLFTFGGGYASLPFLYGMTYHYSWFSEAQLTQLIAIANLTPGPIGINMATFAGFHTLGLLGSIVATTSIILPMIFITSTVFRLLRKFKESEVVKSILYILRPTSCAMIASVGIKLLKGLIIAPFDIRALTILIILFLLTFKLPRNPICYILTGAICAVIIKLF